MLPYLHNIHMQRCSGSIAFDYYFPLVDLKKGSKISMKIILYLVVNMAKHKKNAEERKADIEEDNQFF